MPTRPVTPDDAAVLTLERWLRGPLEPDARVTTLGTLFVVREQPQLVLCDPHLFAGAQALERVVAGDSNWEVRVIERPLVGARRVVALLAERQEPAPPKASRGKRALSAPPPLRWERARFVDGASTYAVDHATVALLDASSLGAMRAHASVRDAVLARCAGPPGYAFVDKRDATCEIAWASCGGDGRWSAWWGLGPDDVPRALVAPFDPALDAGCADDAVSRRDSGGS
jgi:hypothetical protein